ncbi:hypothetical protein DJ568_03155 [Mucilaginibacter hurinus]|uniref:Uncharacterized protein n=1 Tax=Mucilaginibacter hurinus TaxID=2201324 RepID=A0A367GTX3_9SPHI|nr:hypothetical protein [Mucilaginibacter hurinus]RCH56867.1 hypothetical protein DJ568_03155 [Mucilaginibacter hurinus]
MDRLNLTCLLSGVSTKLQLDHKKMPGEAGPCFMVTENGSFKGYISKGPDGKYRSLGTSYFTTEELGTITDHIIKKK